MESLDIYGTNFFGYSTDSWTFVIGVMIFTNIVRFISVVSMVKIGRSAWADKTRITRRPVITEKQLERESVWPIGLLYDLALVMVARWFGTFAGQPLMNWWGFAVSALLHVTVVEFVYYWFHRALHIGWMFKRWHAYHHASINTEATTSFSFEPGERIIYTLLFSIAPFGTYYLGYGSWATFVAYLVWFDIVNGFGHINFELMPKWYSSSPLWYFWYTPSYHSIHHTRFKKNFSLFMLWPDILFGTADMNLTLNVFNGALDQAAPIVEEPVPPEVVPLV